MSKIVIDELKCGQCGNNTFTLYHVSEADDHGRIERVGGHGSGGFPGVIRTICTECEDVTDIKPVPAQLTISDEGNLSGGWNR